MQKSRRVAGFFAAVVARKPEISRPSGVRNPGDGSQIVTGEAPHAEMFEYAIDLRSMTQARGSFTMEFTRYEEVPSNIAEEIIKEAQAQKE